MYSMFQNLIQFSSSGSCGRASLMEEKKEPTDDTGTDVYSQLLNSQHVLGIIKPIIRRTDCIKPRVVLACNTGRM